MPETAQTNTSNSTEEIEADKFETRQFKKEELASYSKPRGNDPRSLRESSEFDQVDAGLLRNLLRKRKHYSCLFHPSR